MLTLLEYNAYLLSVQLQSQVADQPIFIQHIIFHHLRPANNNNKENAHQISSVAAAPKFQKPFPT